MSEPVRETPLDESPPPPTASDRRRSRSASSSPPRHRSRRRRSRSRPRRRRRSRSRRRHRHSAAADLLRSAPFTLRPPDRPAADWVCGVCGNPNSARREDCFRCGTAFAESVAATPSAEVRIANVPRQTDADALRRAVSAPFVLHHDTCTVEACAIVHGAGYVRFASVAEATRAITFSRSALSIGETVCAMRFSDADVARGCGAAKADGLPDALRPEAWRPIPAFASEVAEKAYLDTLSQHWEHLTREQKHYYDERVRRALAAQRRKTTQQADDHAHGTPAAAASVGESSLDSIKRRLAEKRQAVQGASAAGSSEATPTASVASLKERLAMKRANLSAAAAAAAKAPLELESVKSNAPPQEVCAVATALITSAAAGASSTAGGGMTGGCLQKETVQGGMHCFFGFPIPSRFPTKTDYLANTKSPSFRSGVLFRYVPPAVAERIVPPAARPPPMH